MMMMVPMMMPNGMTQMQQVPMSTGNQGHSNNFSLQNNAHDLTSQPQSQGQSNVNSDMPILTEGGNAPQASMGHPMQHNVCVQPMYQMGMQSFDTSSNNTQQQNNIDDTIANNEGSISMPNLNIWGETPTLVPNSTLPQQNQNLRNTIPMGTSYQTTSNQAGQQSMVAGLHSNAAPTASNPGDTRANSHGRSRGDTDGSGGQSYSSNLAHCA